MKMKRAYWIFSIIILWATCAYLFIYFYKIEKTSKVNEIIGHQKIHAHLATKNFEQLFNKFNNILYYLSRDSNIVVMDKKGKNDLEILLKFIKNEIKGITRTDESGKVIFTLPANPKLIGTDISSQKHMAKILADHQPVVSEVFTAIQGYQAIVIHYPIFKNGKFQGTIALLLDFERISNDILKELELGKAGYAWLLSSEGVEIFCREPGHEDNNIYDRADNHSPDLLKMVGSMLKGKEGIISLSNKDIAYYMPIKINNTFWSLAIIRSEKEITSSLVSFRNRLVVIMIIIFLSGLFFSYFGIKAFLILKESELRKLAENQLKASEERYRKVIETTDTGYAVCDNDGIILEANRQYAHMAGYDSPAEVVGKSVQNWTSSKDYTLYKSLIDKCKKNGSVQNLELEFINKNSRFPIEINASKIDYKQQEQIIILCRNILERKLAKEELMKERSLLRTLIDHLPSGVFVKDFNYRKVIANPLHTISVLGHLRRSGKNSAIDIIGKTDFEVFSKEEAEAFLKDDSRVIEKGEAILNQVEPGWGPDDEKIWLLVSKVPLKAIDGSVTGMVGITTDITNQKKFEEQLIVARDKAVQSDRLKTAFLNNISHEIRTPLNAIIGFSGLLKDTDLTEERRDHFIEIIGQSSNQLLLIITDIINIATIEAGQLKYNTGKVDINSSINILYEQYKGTADFKNLEFTFTTNLPSSEAFIETDATKFIGVLSNLINNALKFTEEGSVSFGYQVEEDTIIFFVEDTGIGIKPVHHNAIFERFWQVDSPFSNKYGGTGLGLSISKTYVELMGGRIWLTSEEGNGSIFYFTLPYRKVNS